VGPSPRGRKLPRYGMISLARDRGRAMRFILHGEGRVANREINRAHATEAEPRVAKGVPKRPMAVYAFADPPGAANLSDVKKRQTSGVRTVVSGVSTAEARLV